jgi:hypothetical protein
MSRIDALPADQRSVLQLLLRQGKGYDDLSDLLRLDAAEVRSRAHDALDALGPGALGLPGARRHEIADWLLGQQEPDQAAATRAFVDGSPAARTWAHGVARELEPLAGDRLPALPAEGAPTPATAAKQEPAAKPQPAPAEHPAFGSAPIAPAPSAAPRVSRRGGAALIAGALTVAAIAVVLVLVLGGGGDDKDKKGATNAADTTSTSTQPQVRAQVNLTPPEDAPAKKALAIVQIVDVSGQEAINAVSQGLPTTNKAAYGIWVYASPSQAKLIGGFDKKDNNGHLVYQGALPKGVDITAYNQILVTRETSGSPKQPGKVYLRGNIPKSSGG